MFLLENMIQDEISEIPAATNGIKKTGYCEMVQSIKMSYLVGLAMQEYFGMTTLVLVMDEPIRVPFPIGFGICEMVFFCHA